MVGKSVQQERNEYRQLQLVISRVTRGGRVPRNFELWSGQARQIPQPYPTTTSNSNKSIVNQSLLCTVIATLDEWEYANADTVSNLIGSGRTSPGNCWLDEAPGSYRSRERKWTHCWSFVVQLLYPAQRRRRRRRNAGHSKLLSTIIKQSIDRLSGLFWSGASFSGWQKEKILQQSSAQY